MSVGQDKNWIYFFKTSFGCAACSGCQEIYLKDQTFNPALIYDKNVDETSFAAAAL